MNVGNPGTYTVSVNAPAGVDVAVEPTSLTFAANETREYAVTFTSNAAAEFDEIVFGSLTWSNGPTAVRSPIAVTPVALAAPAEVSGNGTPLEYDITFGYTGAFAVAERGLLAATETAGSVVDDPANSFSPTGTGITTHAVTIAAGTSWPGSRCSTRRYPGQRARPQPLRLQLGRRAGRGKRYGHLERAGRCRRPAAGDYTVDVHGWQTAGGVTANYTLFSWQLGSADAGNMTATSSASTATVGGPGTISLTFSSALVTGKRYLGAVDYRRGANVVGSTLVSIKKA